jgi:hypothetical protein
MALLSTLAWPPAAWKTHHETLGFKGFNQQMGISCGYIMGYNKIKGLV